MRTTTRAAATFAAIALGVSGFTASPSVAAPAAAAKAPVQTNNTFGGVASGVDVLIPGSELLASRRLGASTLGCVSRVPVKNTNNVADIDLDGFLDVGPVTTSVGSSRIKGGGKRTTSISKLADVTLGDPSTLALRLTGLTAKATATQQKNGNYVSSSTTSALKLRLIGAGGVLPDIPLPSPGDLGGADPVVIPGVARIAFSETTKARSATGSSATATILSIKVLAPIPELEGLTIAVGTAEAGIRNRGKNGLVRGVGYGVSGDLLDGVIPVGTIGGRKLPCNGTNGKTLTSGTAELDLSALGLSLGAAQGIVSGETRAGRPLAATVRGRVAGVILPGGLKIGAVRAEALTKRVKVNGKFVIRRIGRTQVLNVTANGENYTAEINQAIKDQESVEIPGLASITPNVVTKTKKGVSVVGLQITLLEGTPLGSTVNLAGASAYVMPR